MNRQIQISYLKVLVFYLCVEVVKGQGRLLSPPGRSSLWRFGYGTPINSNDNALSCGGIQHRWKVNQGKCGVCGDPWDIKPRDNEAGGQYAREIIAGVYKSGSLLEAVVEVANNNGGYFEFRICAHNNFSSPVKAECLEKELLTLEDDVSTRYYNIQSGYNTVLLKIPYDLTCDQCVLQWKYRTADQYGCETGGEGKEVCGFGYGEIQTEYYACADIAIYPDDKSVQEYNKFITGLDATSGSYTNRTSMLVSRAKRTTHRIFSQNTPTVSKEIFFQPNSRSNTPFSGREAQVEWSWNIKHIKSPVDYNTVVGRMRRRTHQLPQVPEGISFGNPHLNGLVLPKLHSSGTVRSSFNSRRNGIFHSDGQSTNKVSSSKGIPIPNIPFNPIGDLFNTQTKPMPAVIMPPERSLAQVSEPAVRAIVRPVAKMTVQSVSVSGTPTASLTVNKMQPPSLMRKLDIQMHRNFIDPLSPLLQPGIASNTQKILSRSNYKPTKKCMHCPFDQCLDDKLRIDHLFPGLFDSPTQFFECKRFERVFTLGNYDVVQEGLPDCGHPRFRRQLLTQFDDDDIGCCATRPQVILPLTVEAENDTFSVVQLGDAKKQFIVQGICGKSNTTTCTICAAENNFQWVLVYDPRVNTNPPVSFVPVKFPHYCRCYNYMSLKGKR